MADEVGIDVAFQLDKSDLDSSFRSYLGDIQDSFGDVLNQAQELERAIAGIARPLKDVASEAETLRKAFQEVKDLSQSIRENVASTRLHGTGMGGGITGMGGGGGGGGGVGVGSALMSMLGPWGAVATGVLAGAPMAIGGGLLAATATGLGMTDSLRDPNSMLSRAAGALGIDREAVDAFSGRDRRAPSISDIASGRASITDLLGAMMHGDVAGAAGTIGTGVGIMRGLGRGPMGFLNMAQGTGYGARFGAQWAQGLGFGAIGQGVGAAIGGTVLPGVADWYQQEAMSRYPQFLATMSSMASVGMYGGSMRQMRALRPSRFGYTPEEQGQAFSAMFQGYGGGPLTSDTQLTAMAYSRAYGVDMGAIGQAMGGLINVGGGGQGATAQMREQITARVMADAVSEGFGRRLPEFAGAVGTGMQAAMSGPALIEQSAMPGLIAQMSRMTGLVATRHGVGLEGANRILAPFVRAPQDMLEGLMGGGGDPQYRQALQWSLNRERFGNDPMRFADALAEASRSPFSHDALEMHRRPLENILRSSPNDYSAMRSLRTYFPDISYQGVRGILQRGRAAMDENGSLAGADMSEIFTDITEEQRNEGQDTRETMRDIQRSGEDIMNEQLSAMRANAGFAESQLGISAMMARDAAQFYRAQIGLTRVGTEVMTATGIATSYGALASIAQAAEGAPTEGDRARIVLENFLEHMGMGRETIQRMVEERAMEAEDEAGSFEGDTATAEPVRTSRNRGRERFARAVDASRRRGQANEARSSTRASNSTPASDRAGN